MVFFAQSLRYAQKIIRGILKHMPPVIFFACLNLEQKSSFMDGHYPNSFKFSYQSLRLLCPPKESKYRTYVKCLSCGMESLFNRGIAHSTRSKSGNYDLTLQKIANFCIKN